MEGYPGLAAEVAAAAPGHPVTLPVRGEVAAGDTGRRDLVPGTCIKIMTGALLPSGADAVVPVEWTDGGPAADSAGGTGRVTIRQTAEPVHPVRPTRCYARP